jgi:Methyltransferase domain
MVLSGAYGDRTTMVTRELEAFVRAALPAPPARVLEIGAGRGELAIALSKAGYAITAVDPAAEPAGIVQPISLLEARSTRQSRSSRCTTSTRSRNRARTWRRCCRPEDSS